MVVLGRGESMYGHIGFCIKNNGDRLMPLSLKESRALTDKPEGLIRSSGG